MRISEQARAQAAQLWPPNAITLLALCAGLSALVFAAEGRIAAAIACILLSGLLDGCDGRVARMTGGVSKFGAELDSLADVVSFGAVPAFVLYQWGLSEYGAMGWLACLTLASACALRLARFNVAASVPGQPSWKANYFCGVPAPAGAFLALAPAYADLAGLLPHAALATTALVSVPAVAAMMVSRWPTFSGKVWRRKPPKMMIVPPLMLALAIAVCLALWPWGTLCMLALGYCASLPLSKLRHDILARRGPN